MQCLQVGDVIPILSPAVYCGFGKCASQRFAWWHSFLTGVKLFIEVVVFCKALI